MQPKNTPFDPFLRVSPKLLHQSNYDWLVEQINEHTGDACLVWPFAANKKGFGIVKVKGQRGSSLVHRIAYELATGTVAKNCVIQTCEDRLCFAPKHLEEREHSRWMGNRKPRPHLLYAWLVEKIGTHHSDECLLWPHATSGPMKYGVVVMPDGKHEYVHRIAFFLTHGHWPYPETLHSCDVPTCFNPRHLSENTHAANSADMADKGRAKSPALKGEAHGRSKLTAEQAAAVRAEYASGGISMMALGAKYGVSNHSIWCIINRKSWTHV